MAGGGFLDGLMGGAPKPTQTVGEYLATPCGASGLRQLAGFLAFVGAVCLVLAAADWVFGGRMAVEYGVLSAESVDLRGFILPLTVAGVLLVVAAVVVNLVIRVRGLAAYDVRDAVKKATLTAMLAKPRFGVTRATLLSSVQMRSKYLGNGAGTGAVMCWSARIPFMAEDFAGGSARASDYGGVDALVVDGRLVVFFTIAAKKKWLERMRRKAG